MFKSLEKLLIKFEGWPGLLGAFILTPVAFIAVLLFWQVWIGKIFWIFVFGGFAVIFHFWHSWLDNRWGENIIGNWWGSQEFTSVYIQPPSQNTRSFAAMEAFFRNMHAIHTTKSPKNQYFEGVWYRLFTIEIHSIGGRVGFFAYMFKSDFTLFKQALLAHYPDCVVTECEDPLGYMSKKWNRTSGVDNFKNCVAADFSVLRSDMYPTKTWRELQSDGTTTLYDPMMALLSSFEAVKSDEHLVLQFVLRPVVGPNIGDWNKLMLKDAEELKKKLATNSDVEATKFGTMALTREEQALIQAVQQKVNQGALYQTKIRFMAISPDNKAINAYLGYPANFFKQLDGLNNSLYPTDQTKTTKASNFFPLFDNLYWKYEKMHRQERAFNAIRSRSWDRSGPAHVQTPDSLAAIIHMPITNITDTGVNMRIQSNFGLTPNSAPSGTPPINLPT